MVKPGQLLSSNRRPQPFQQVNPTKKGGSENRRRLKHFTMFFTVANIPLFLALKPTLFLCTILWRNSKKGIAVVVVMFEEGLRV
jgi:hypothetical protein